MRITHVVVTDAFAGAERYVSDVARLQSARGHDVLVLGGQARRMQAAVGGAGWAPSPTPAAALRALLRSGRREVVHAHLTSAEAAAALTRPAHRATVVATRHIAGVRGSSRVGRVIGPWVGRRIDVELAISEHVAAASGGRPRVVHNGVASCDTAYDLDSRVVLVLQRLEPEKDTVTALDAWRLSRLWEQGWRLRVAGDGLQRAALETVVSQQDLPGVEFLGHVGHPEELLATAGILLAPTPSEGLGLSVLEAMSFGVPVVLSASGGHLEAAPASWTWSFPPGDAHAAARALVRLTDDAERQSASAVVRAHQRAGFDLDQHVETLLQIYASRPATRRGPRA